jgi:hypothetical protein
MSLLDSAHHEAGSKATDPRSGVDPVRAPGGYHRHSRWSAKTHTAHPNPPDIDPEPMRRRCGRLRRPRIRLGRHRGDHQRRSRSRGQGMTGDGCIWCAFKKSHARWPEPGTHCMDCHRSWRSLFRDTAQSVMNSSPPIASPNSTGPLVGTVTPARSRSSNVTSKLSARCGGTRGTAIHTPRSAGGVDHQGPEMWRRVPPTSSPRRDLPDDGLPFIDCGCLLALQRGPCGVLATVAISSPPAPRSGGARPAVVPASLWAAHLCADAGPRRTTSRDPACNPGDGPGQEISAGDKLATNTRRRKWIVGGRSSAWLQ